MPIIRATVTVAAAAPKATRPAASTAAVDRGVTVNPKPIPKTAPEAAKAFVETVGLHVDIQASPPALTARPTRVSSRRDRPRDRPEDDPLLIRAAVEDAIDEDRPADDRRRHPIAGQERDQGR
jgi:hypothetical protein